MSRISTLLFLTIMIASSGCAEPATSPPAALPSFITATLPPTATIAPTLPPAQPTITPTIPPIAGKTTTEVNVREDTSTASRQIGGIPAFSPVQVIGKDASGLWLNVMFNGISGWVRAEFIQLDDASVNIPVMAAGEDGQPRAVVTRGVNVRNGPGQEHDSLGLLNQNDVIAVLGTDQTGTWAQISYPPAPSGVGWVAVEFLQIENLQTLPVINGVSEAIQTQAPEVVEIVTNVRIAQFDGDSSSAPLALLDLTATTARAFQWSGEVSAPEGDAEDWVGFSAHSTEVVIQVLCKSGSVQVELSQNNNVLATPALTCESKQSIQISPGRVYLLHITPYPLQESLFGKYQLKVELGR